MRSGVSDHVSNEAGRVENSSAVLELTGVKKFYGNVEAVKGVDLSVVPGEILTLLGPSGCGKTTTLRMVLGLERISAGRIEYGGRLLDGGTTRPIPVHKRDMGMVFQSYAIWPHMTVGQNIGYPLRVRRRKKADIAEAVAKAAELVSMGHLIDRPATMLSGGQQQRVALARALVFEPGMLLLDEPFSNLDARLRDEMRAEVKLLQRRIGITILFVTHDQHEALSMSDRIAVMSDGRVEQLGRPEELYSRPATRMVRDFVGKSNVLTGRVSGAVGDGARVRLDEDFGGNELVAGLPTDIAAGSACEVSIRHEDVVIRRVDNDTPANALQGRLGGLLFLGDRYEVVVNLPSGRMIVGGVAPGTDVREGDDVWVVLPENKLLLWPQAD